MKNLAITKVKKTRIIVLLLLKIVKWIRAYLKAIIFHNLITYFASSVTCLIFNQIQYYFCNKYVPSYKTDTYLFNAIKVPFLLKKTACNWLDWFLITFVARY